MSDLLKHKISNYEVTPPGEVWNNIASELDEGRPFVSLFQKMYGYEAEPPVGVWEKISRELNTADQAPVRQMRPMIIKLAAAAVILGVIIISSLYFMHQQTTIQKVAGAKHRQDEPKAKTGLPEMEDDPIPRPVITASLPPLAFASPHKIRNDIRESFQRKKRALTASSVKPDYADLNEAMDAITVHARLIRNERGDLIQARHLIDDDEYISVTGPNGQQTKISAKFADLLPYLSRNENMQNEELQQKFQDWRTKIMRTSFIPSSNNFFDILELKDFILSEKQ